MQGTTGSYYTDKCVFMYNLWYCNIRDKSIVIKELYLLNTVTLYPSSFWLTPKDKRT